MRAVVVSAFGGPEQLALRDVAEVAPGPGQVRVRTSLTSVNFSDVMSRRGTGAVTHLPFTPGLDCVGTVDALGEGVTSVALGQRVAAWPTAGSYAERVVAREALVHALPDEVGDAEGAALTVLVTAYNVLRVARLVPGDTVLVHAAAGGVGLLAVQLARLLGAATVIAVTSTPDKGRAACAHGADVALDPSRDDVPERARELTGGVGVDVVLDSVGGATTERSLTCLAPFGRLVVYGGASGEQAVVPAGALYRQDRAVLGYSTGHHRASRPEALARPVRQVFGHVVRGELRVVEAARLPLAEAAQAHRLVEGRQVVGRVLLVP